MSSRVPAGIVEAMTAFSIASGGRRFGWQAVDASAAVLLTSIAVAEVASSGHATAPAAIAAAMLAATVGWCRRAPTGAVCVGLLSGAVLALVGGIDLAITPVVTMFAYFMLGRESAARRPFPVDALLVALPVPLVAASPGTSHVVGVGSVWLFFFAAPFVAGRWVGRGTLLASELRDNVDELARQQRDRATSGGVRGACADRPRAARRGRAQRQRHGRADPGSAAGRRRDLVAAAGALQSVSSCGRDALVDMRRMIGVLHRNDLDLATPGLAQLPALVERAEASGLIVSLEVMRGRCRRSRRPSILRRTDSSRRR